LKEERAALNNEIRVNYLVGNVTGAQLVAYGPQGAAGRLTSIPELKAISERTDTKPTQKMQVSGENAAGEPLKPKDIPNGRYRWEASGRRSGGRVSGTFTLVEAYPTDNVYASWEPGSVRLKRWVAETQLIQDPVEVAPGANDTEDAPIDPMRRVALLASKHDGIVTVELLTRSAPGGSAQARFGSMETEEGVMERSKAPVLRPLQGVGMKENEYNELTRLWAPLVAEAAEDGDSGIVNELAGDTKPHTIFVKQAAGDKKTPFKDADFIGKFGGGLKDVKTGELVRIVIEEAVKRAGISPQQVVLVAAQGAGGGGGGGQNQPITGVFRPIIGIL
jgi:hypothetical protein